MTERPSTVTIIVRIAIVVVAVGLFVALFFPGRIPRRTYVAIDSDLPSDTPAARKVLFVGNSHTYVHEVPIIVQRLVPKSAPPLYFDALTSPSKYLNWHVARGDVGRLAARIAYDTVVLQPASGELINGTPIADINALAAAVPGAQVILFQTWPRHPERDEFAARYGTIEAWNEITSKNAMATKRRISPIGTIWVCLYRKTRYDLWSADGNHAAITGAYVTALTLERTLYGPEAGWSDYVPDGLPADVAKQLREAVDRCWSNRASPPSESTKTP